MSEMNCVSEQGQSGILWTVFEGAPFSSRRIASFADANDAREYLKLRAENESLKADRDEARDKCASMSNALANIGDTCRVRGFEGGLSNPIDERVIRMIQAAEAKLKAQQPFVDWVRDHQQAIFDALHYNWDGHMTGCRRDLDALIKTLQEQEGGKDAWMNDPKAKAEFDKSLADLDAKLPTTPKPVWDSTDLGMIGSDQPKTPVTPASDLSPEQFEQVKADVRKATMIVESFRPLSTDPIFKTP